MTFSSERRRYSRVRFDTAATLAQDGNAYHTHVIDLSLNGALLETPKDYELRADQTANISIFLNESTEIQMLVSLAHSTSKYLGFRCESIEMESASHLRRLIELNLDDPNAAERVLDELVSEF